ncbi:MAG: ABC transporter substrate-binding protein [Methanotrichaceae archaeon]
MKTTSVFMLMVLLASSTLLVVMPAGAQGIVVLGDLDGNRIVSDEEMGIAEQEYQDGKITSDDLEEIRHIHENYPINIIDSVGNEVTIWKPLERIVVFNSETIETMRSLNAQDRIIGVGKYTAEDSVFFPELSKLSSIGSVWSPDIEAVLQLHPDAVFIYGTFMKNNADEIQQTLESADPNIVVVRLDCFKPESYRDEVQNLGKILEQENEAEEYLDFYNGCMDKIEDVVGSISEDEKPSVYLESWTDYRTCTQGAGWHSKLVMAGGKNIFGDIAESYKNIDPESIIVRDPEIVIKLCGAGGFKFGGYSEGDGTSKMKELRKDIVSRPGWENITAVKDGHVYVLSNDILGGAQHFIGIAYLAKIFHPDLFKDMDPEVTHQEYLTRFQGLEMRDWNFVYPEI